MLRIDLLKTAKECAEKAGIAHRMFLSFGTMLGAIREHAFITHDTDADLGFLPVNKEQKELYYRECGKAGLLEWVHPLDRVSRTCTGDELLWFSIKNDFGKSCNWFFFQWNNYLWHSKGTKWLIKFHEKEYPRDVRTTAIMLGAPVKYFNELVEIDFEGERFNIPLDAGSLCDFWYNGWIFPRKGGSSERKIVGSFINWEDKSTWEIL